MTQKWVQDAPKITKGITWGQPWAQGQLQTLSGLSLPDRPLQAKVQAYWPDGSIKWTKASAVFQAGEAAPKTVSVTDTAPAGPALADRSYNGVFVDTGKIKVFFPTHGPAGCIIASVKAGEQVLLTNLGLVAQYDDTQLKGDVTKVEIEDNGPVMAEIKVSGTVSVASAVAQRFALRFKFFAGLSRVEVLHTLTVVKPLPIAGLGLSYQVPLVGQPWERQIKFADTAVYDEAAQLLISRRFRYDNAAYIAQAHGQLTTFSPDDAPMLERAAENALFDHYAVTQLTADSYTISKQTAPDCVPIQVGTGRRYPGTVYIGGTTSGVAVSMGEFWQKAPSELVVDGLTERATQVTAWLWSPKAQPMNFAHYDKHSHTGAYEGMDELRSTAVGVANSSRLALDFYTQPADNTAIQALSDENQRPAQLVLTPQDYHAAGVFGVWGLPDTKDPKRAFLEAQMVELRKFYEHEVDQRGWYGYWNFGDVMHTYDAARHQWFYDLGGYAWQNTELMINLWLWLDFMRTGDSELYYFASAMTRHNSEVDVYHEGQYRGLGSRHNVVHWGDAAKEMRISMAYLNRFYYYLTGDSRIGELMSDEKDIDDHAFDHIEPLRAYFDHADVPAGKVPIRIGTEWTSMAADWLSEWERSGDPEYKRRITNGFNTVKKVPHQLVAGQIYLFDKQSRTIEYWPIKHVFGFHMMISFGAPQIWMESAELLQDDEWAKAVAELGRFYGLSPEEKVRQSNGKYEEKNFSWPMFATGIEAYGAHVNHDHALAKLAWHNLLTPSVSGVPVPIADSKATAANWHQVTEYPWITTNVVAQWCLNLIMCLALIGDDLPNEIPGMNGYIPIEVHKEQK